MPETRVFYGPIKEEEPDRSPHESGSGSGSEAETELEELVAKKFKRLHRKIDSVDRVDPSELVPKRQRKVARSKPAAKCNRDINGRLPLQRFCDKGNLDKVKELVDEGADVNDRDYAGTAVLHSAALQGDVDVIKYLLDHGAIVDIRSGPDELDTPLIDAVSNGLLDVVKILLKYGADPRIANAAGETAVDFLDDTEEESKEISKLLKEATQKLRERGPPIEDPSKAPKNTFPPSMTALSSEEEDTAPRSRTASGSAQRRRQNDLFIDLSSKSGRQEVIKRAAQGDLEYIGMSLEHGWQPKAEALVLAAKHGHTDIVGLLLAYGTAVDVVYDGVTALHETLGRGHLATVELLIDSGANLKWKDRQGRTYADIVEDLPPTNEERQLIRSKLGLEKPRESKPKVDKTDKPEKKPIKEKQVVPKKESEAPTDSTKNQSSSSTVESRPVGPSEEKTEKSAEPKALEKPVEKTVQTSVESAPKPVEKHAEKATEREPSEAPEKKRSEQKHKKSITWKDDVEEHAGDTSFERKQEKAREEPEPLKRAQSPGIRSEISPRDSHSLEMAQKLEELAARREKERRQREARMLEALAQEEQKRAARQSISHADGRPSVDEDTPMKDAHQDSVAIGTDISRGNTPTPVPEGQVTSSSPAPAPAPVNTEKELAKFPFAVRQLAYTGQPQAHVLPLLGLREKNATSDYERDPRSYHLIDLQVALYLGSARFNEQYPDFERISISEQEKQQIWSLVDPWLTAPEASVEEKQADKQKFLAMPLFWLRGDQVSAAVGSKGPLRVVPISLPSKQTKASTHDEELEKVGRQLPLRFAFKVRMREHLSQWEV